MIRFGEPKDASRILEIAEQQHRESGFSHLPFNPAKTLCTWTDNITNPHKAAFVVELDGQVEGFLTCGIKEYNFCDGVYVADEHFNVTEKGRGRGVYLLRALLRWAKGVDVVLGINSEINTERVESLYKRLGFKRIGSYWRA